MDILVGKEEYLVQSLEEEEEERVCKCCQIFLTNFLSMLPCLHPLFSHLAFPLVLSTQHQKQMEVDGPGHDDRPGRPRGALKNNDLISALQFF